MKSHAGGWAMAVLALFAFTGCAAMRVPPGALVVRKAPASAKSVHDINRALAEIDAATRGVVFNP
jgi:hypothetical protein